MDPEEISRLAEREKKKKAKTENSPREPFNPFDWMDFKNTRNWMRKNLALSDKFYSFLFTLLIGTGLATWFYLQDEKPWELYTMIISGSLLCFSSVAGFIYGYVKRKNNPNHNL